MQFSCFGGIILKVERFVWNFVRFIEFIMLRVKAFMNSHIMRDRLSREYLYKYAR